MVIARSGQLYLRLRDMRSRLVLVVKRLRQVDRTAYIHPSSVVARDLRASEYVFVGKRCTIPPQVVIGRYSMLAANVAIVGNDHSWNEPGIPIQFSGRPKQLRTTIGVDTWIGHGVTIISGTKIGDGAIVAASAVVTRDVPSFEMWAGIPARKIGDRFVDESTRTEHRALMNGILARPRFADRKTASTRPRPSTMNCAPWPEGASEVRQSSA